MEMCYDGALVMPNSYSEVSSEEMEYIDGGRNGWWNKVGFIGGLIDVGIICFTAGQAIAGIAAMKTFLRRNSRKLVKNVSKAIRKMIGSVSSVVITSAIDIALTCFSTSIGGLIALGLDIIDGKRNGYVFG